MSGALHTDLYGLNMAASYLRRRMTGHATFSLFVRRLPPDRGYLVAAGLEDCLDHLQTFHFDDGELAYLSTVGFGDDTLDRFAGLRFTGDVWAVPEGRLVLAGEPLLEVTAPIAEGQLVESFLLNQTTFQTSVATKAARCRVAAAGRMELVEFGLRRAQGIDAADAAARLAVMVGFAGTSNVEAARRFGLQASGTMAHSYVEAFPTELDAFRAFAEDRPGPVTFLVDTYDTMRGVDHAVEVIRRLGLERTAAVRLDSGDLAALARRARTALDGAGLPEVRILVSGNLDEYAVEALVAAGAPVDAAGIGTRLATAADAPYVDSAYKLVEHAGRPVLKLSEGKQTLPGAKQVHRRDGCDDTICRRDEEPPAGAEPLLRCVMAGGRRLAPPGPLSDARHRFEADLAGLPDRARRLRDPVAPVPAVSRALRRLEAETRGAAQR